MKNGVTKLGTIAASYAEITRSGNAYWQSTVTTSVGALGVDNMASAFDAAKVGNEAPTLIVTTPTVWTSYEGLLQPTVSHNVNGYQKVTRNRVSAPGEALKGEIGFDALMYRGVPVVADEKCTSGYVYFLNENYLEWLGLPSNKMGYKPINISSPSTVESPGYFDAPSTYGFFWTGFKIPTNQDAEIGQILLYGNLCNKSPRMHSVLQGVS